MPDDSFFMLILYAHLIKGFGLEGSSSNIFFNSAIRRFSCAIYRGLNER